MSVSSRQIEEQEDFRVLVQSRALGAYGAENAMRYANQLLDHAMQAYAASDLDKTIWLTKREFDFSCRAFGFQHPYTVTSMKCLQALSRRERVIGRNLRAAA